MNIPAVFLFGVRDFERSGHRKRGEHFVFVALRPFDHEGADDAGDEKRDDREDEGELHALLSERPVSVSEFAVLGEARKVSIDGHDYLDLDVRITCSSGTYIRALARDLGQALGSFGHLTALRRTRIGGYSVGDAQTLDGLTRESLVVTSMRAAVEGFETRDLTEQDEIDLRHGKRIARGAASNTEVVAGVHGDRVVAMLEPKGEQLKSLVVFAKEEL